MKSLDGAANQKGAVTLLTALVLLISIALVALTASKTVLSETQNAANNYRMEQAVAAASAALDYGVGYFDAGGFDHDSDGVVDTITNQIYTSTDNSQTTSASVTFNNAAGTRCVAAGSPPNMKSGMITAVGSSDDGVGVRTISQCVGTIDIFGGNAPKQSLISAGAVGLTGNYNLINRFFNTNVWSGGPVAIGNSNSAATYVLPPGVSSSALTQAQLQDSSTNNSYTSQAISSNSSGNGVDTIANDPRLSSLTGDQLFNNFFYGDRAMMQGLANSLGQVYTDASSAAGNSGVVWINGNTSMQGGTYGTPSNPVIMIVNGNLSASGSPVINGLLYVTGQFDAAGTPTVFGSVIVEGNPAMASAGAAPVVGHGTVNLVYTPYTLNQAPNPIIGTTTVISGSWRDW